MHTDTTSAIRQASSESDFAAARELFTEYQAWLRVDLCFQEFSQELASLPGAYAPPRGRLLLAENPAATIPTLETAMETTKASIVGCVAFRPLDDARCEMKRLFVRPDHHGGGVGRALVTRLLAEARAVGYRAMLLDTLPQMGPAQRLYESLGFRDIEPYYHNPIPGARYLALDLTAS